MVRWHCPPDTGFEIRALAVWGRARYLSVTEAPHNTNFHTWMGKKQFCFFQTAETGNRTPDSGVKGSSANHYPRAPAPCDLEHITTSVLKNCLDILITPITDIINISMETSTSPQNFKEAHVRPLLKKKHFFLKTSWIITGLYQLKFHFQNLRKDSSQ